MIDSKKLLADLQSKSTSRTTLVKKLEDDLRERCDREPEVDAPLKEQYNAAKAKKRTALTYKAWRDDQLTQIAVAWVLACVFVRFLEDNGLVEVPKLSGPGERLRRAQDEHELFIRNNPLGTDREFLLEVFEEAGQLPGMKEFFDPKHNPLWLAAPSGDACSELWQFWQKTDPETGALRYDFTDPSLFAVSDSSTSSFIPHPSSFSSTRFLGDLYQDLSEAARKKYALLQTPEFVEEFILDRTLTPAIETFGYREVRMIDPTCGSGHFLLGGFQRIFRLWQNENPEENPRVLAQRALDAVCGVDLNPFAVAIARFRLLLAALQVCGVRRLADAPDFHIHLAVGDSLIHGARFDAQGNPYVVERETLFGGQEAFKDEHAHFFDTEDAEVLHRILGRQYHAVVGNPPYITVKDKALNQLYRDRYDACHRQYSLSVPFMERFFDLAVAGSREERRPAGFTGQITANSFMKREFGKKLIEEHLPKWDLTHVLDTSGAYIPGHGTPTVILFGRNAKPQAATVRTVMGIKGEPATPDDPARGMVWSAIVDQIDRPGSESEFVSAADTEREKFHKHPWSLQGGGATDLLAEIGQSSAAVLETQINVIGRTTHTGEDEAFVLDGISASRLGFGGEVVPFIEGDLLRDFSLDTARSASCVFPYDQTSAETLPEQPRSLRSHFWTYRTNLTNRRDFGQFIRERGLEWWEHSMFFPARYIQALGLPFAFVATHNHFVLDRGGKVFKQSAPVIKLPADATEDDHLRLLGLLNSSAACFWMKQVFQKKTQMGGGGGSANSPYSHQYEFDGTKLKQFPVVEVDDLTLVRAIQKYAEAMAASGPEQELDAWAAGGGSLREQLAAAEELCALHRRRLIYWQEELDWQVYERYGLIDRRDELALHGDAAVDTLFDRGLSLGERTFEIFMAHQMARGTFETTWFERHAEAGSRPITAPPDDWPEEYVALYHRRHDAIQENKNLNLIERPEFKRRWNTEPWAKRQTEALRKWLVTRLEGYFFEGTRVGDLGQTGPDGLAFDPASHGFIAATRPHLSTVNQLADVVSSDARWMEAAEVYHGSAGFSVATLVRKLVEPESVPFLPVLRYKPSGLRKRHDWEETWDLQRKEDAVEAEVRAKNGTLDEERLKTLIRKTQEEEVGEIPVPPKYTGKDFAKTHYWKLRGKLDVPKERWISYPGAERSGDDSLVIAWAGWDHLQQAQALAEYFIDAKDNQGWQADRLKLLLAGLADLIPWLKQWHNAHNPDYGMGLGDYFAGFLEEQCRALDLTVQEVGRGRFDFTQGLTS